MVQFFLQSRTGQWITLLLLSFVWGTSFILIKKGLLAYDNYQVAAFRVFFAFVLLLPFALRSLHQITRTNLKSLLLVGFVGIAIPSLIFSTAQMHIDSSLAGTLNAMTPVFTLLIGVSIYQSKVFWLNLVGIAIGFAGVFGLIAGDIHHITSGINRFGALVLVASLLYGVNVNEIKNRLQGLSGMTITALPMLFVGPIAGIYLLIYGYRPAYMGESAGLSLLCIFLLSFFSTVLAMILFNSFIKYTTAIFASSVTYIIPVFAIIWGGFDGEKLTWTQILWTLVLLAGVYLVNKKRNFIHV